MCGFVGFTGKLQDKETVLKSMMDTIIHRGPDSGGHFVDDEVALGFRRLSIIDLEHGSQPLLNEDESIVLIFNGEIYNFQELRSELEGKGHRFRTHTDSEVLIHLYEEHGRDMLLRLRGMFAFVIYDVKAGKLFGARDYFGIKPFYYNVTDKGEFIFGSEIKSFLPHPGFKKELNRESLRPYLTFQYPINDETFFKNVFKLPPAHSFTFENGKLSIEKYWSVHFDPKEDTLDNYIQKIEDCVKDSVKYHKISDVKVGSFLSSGVDSSYITAKLMPDKTFTVGFSDETFSEIDSAESLSNLLGIESINRVLPYEECIESLSDIQYHMDEPNSNPSVVPLYFLAKLAKEHVTVVLSGEGADEMFGGYLSYISPPLVGKLRRLPRFIRKPIGSVARRLPDMKGKKFLLKVGGNLEDYFIGQAFIFYEDDANDILKNGYRTGKTVKEIVTPILDRVRDKDELTQMLYLDMHLWLDKDILLKADKMSMAHSLELRVPFLDKKVMELAQAIPSKYKLNGEQTKYVFREAAKRALPAEWADRKKIGFPVPIRNWLRDEKFYNEVKSQFTSPYAAEFFDTDRIVELLDDHFKGKRNNGRKVWTIYTFLIWYKRFFIEMA
jgi:asparagine synthase (glutamine-hydrolysing)